MSKVLEEQRQGMREFLVRSFSLSDIKVLNDLGKDCMLLETPQGRVALFYHSSSENVDDVKRRIRDAEDRGTTLSNIFYKDGETFFVPLTQKQIATKIRGSLQGLSYGDLMGAVSLRDKEQFVLAKQAGERTLVYYQPSNIPFGGRLAEGIVSFQMIPSTKNYLHVEPERKGYEHIMAEHGLNHVDFALSAGKQNLNGRVFFKPARNNSCVAFLAEPKLVQDSLF